MIILCADDYAMTEGVSRAIGELAAARRLSATSVLSTSPHWPRLAPRLLVHRGHLSIGLHVNLTLGQPLGHMPRLAPQGTFPPLSSLTIWALGGVLNVDEIRAEVGRQLDSFEAAMGFPPDHIDGHQHVHVLPGIRRALLTEVAQPLPGPPAADPRSLGPAELYPASRVSAAKALAVAALAIGFSSAAHKRGLRTNDSFAGFSSFDEHEPYTAELEQALVGAGRAASRHVPPGPSGRRAGQPRSGGQPPAHGVRGVDDELGVDDAHLATLAAGRGAPFDWSQTEPRA